MKDRRTETPMETAWNESGEITKALFEAVTDAVYLMEGGRFIDCNSPALSMFGCASKDEMVGRSPLDLSPNNQPDGKSSRQQARTFIANALKGEPQRFMWQHLRLDGTPFDAEVSLSRLPLRGETRLLAVVRDITARKSAERSLAESEELHRKLVMTIPDILVPDRSFGEDHFCKRIHHSIFGKSRRGRDRRKEHFFVRRRRGSGAGGCQHSTHA